MANALQKMLVQDGVIAVAFRAATTAPSFITRWHGIAGTLMAKRIKSVTVRRGGESRLNCPRIDFRVSQAGFDPNAPGPVYLHARAAAVNRRGARLDPPEAHRYLSAAPPTRIFDDHRPSRPYAPGALVSGLDPGPAAVLGGPGLRHPAALRHGGRRRHLPPGDHAAGARAEALERRLRAAVAAAEGRPLRREPEPAAALLPVPGDPEAVAARPAGALSEVARRHRRRPQAARHPLRRGRLGEPDARRLGARLGVLVRRHGGVAVHLLPAGRGLRMLAGRGRTDLRAGAARHVCAGRRPRL